MKRVNAVGYYGWDNFGDELFRAAVALNQERIWGPGARVKSFVTPVRKLHQDLGPVGRATRFIETLVGALWADTIALCGGSVLQDVRGNQRMRGAILRRIRRIEAIGVSLGPWDSADARTRVREYLHQLKRVVVRDQASWDRIGGDVVVGGDLAALYPMPTIAAHERQNLTICLSNDSKASVTDVSITLTALLSNVRVPVTLLSLNVRQRYGDEDFTEAVYRELRADHIPITLAKFETVDQTIDILARSKAVWSQRLHGLIVAYLCDVPILALSHHKKITDFANHIGLPDRFLSETLEPTEKLRQAAEETLVAPPEWSVTPSQYRELTVAAIASTVGSAVGTVDSSH